MDYYETRNNMGETRHVRWYGVWEILQGVWGILQGEREILQGKREMLQGV